MSSKDINAKPGAMGPLGLLFQSIFSLITVCILPHIIEKFLSDKEYPEETGSENRIFSQRMIISRLSYLNIWLASLLLSATAILGILTTKSSKAMVFTMGLTGISWGIMNWIPSVLINLEILRRRDSPEMNRHGENSAATVIGINNVSISVPQIFAMLGGAIIFSIVKEKENEVPMKGIRWILSGSCIMMLIATFCVLRVKGALMNR